MRKQITYSFLLILLFIGMIALQREIFQWEPYALILTVPLNIIGLLWIPYHKILK